jgi:hypothetical protein
MVVLFVTIMFVGCMLVDYCQHRLSRRAHR